MSLVKNAGYMGLFFFIILNIGIPYFHAPEILKNPDLRLAFITCVGAGYDCFVCDLYILGYLMMTL